MSNKRLMVEIKRLDDLTKIINFKYTLIDDSFKNIMVKIFNINSDFSGEYYLTIEPIDFPFKPPKIKFLTPNGLFEINVYICLGGLTHFHSNDWPPSTTLDNIILSIYSYFSDPSKNIVGIGLLSKQTNDVYKKIAIQSTEYNINNIKCIIN